MEISYREQTDEERAVQERWTAFTDRAEVAPDCPRDAERLARRFNEKTRGMTTPDYVRKIMPENHPNYPWTRT